MRSKSCSMNTCGIRIWGFRTSAVRLLSLVLIMGVPISGFTQTEFLAAGLSVAPRGSSAVSGSALYAQKLYKNTYGFTSVDAIPDKKGAVDTNWGVGVAQKVYTLHQIPIFVPVEVGLSSNGAHVGWEWDIGVMASVKVGKNFYVFPTVRADKSSVSDHSGLEPIFGVLFGWGK